MINNNWLQNDVAFIIGAGFNVDVATEVGCQKRLPSSGLLARYPLASDLLKICFKENTNSFNKSIEELFQESIDKKEERPIINLCNYLMELDWYITPYLIKNPNNSYVRFLRNFPESHLITFDYESLLEILLLAEGFWFPGDGYGVPVQFNREPIRKGPKPDEKSLRYVLHLHGSLCVYVEDLSIEKKQMSCYSILQESNPKYLFDPTRYRRMFYPILKNIS